MNSTTSRSFWLTFLGVSILLSLPAFYQSVTQFEAAGILIWKSKWLFLLGIFLLNAAAGAYLFWKLCRGKAETFTSRLELDSLGRPWSILAILILVGGLAAVWYIRLAVFGEYLPQLFPSLWVFWWSSLFQAAGLKILTRRSWAASFAFVILVQGVIYRSFGALRAVTPYPFSLEYSETSRFYYGSLLFSDSIYGMDLPLSPWHPTRYFLLAIPFLVKGLPLWAHRLWQALLWIGLTGTTSLLLTRRLKFTEKGVAFLVAAWYFLYLFQGAVYYHLQVSIIVIFLGVSHRHPWRALIAVLAASFWAGMSRLNWFPVPAMLAAALYLLEKPVSSSPSLWRYLFQPVIWAVLGLGTALLGQGLYIVWSGAADVRAFGSSLTSALLWNRLLPNPTYPLGVLSGILLVSAPLFGGLMLFLRGRRENWHFIRPLGLGAMLLVLFSGGLIVSVKIGGGADIHNMDAYMVLLGLTAAYFFAGRVEGEKVKAGWGKVPFWLVTFALLIPIGFSIPGVQPLFSYDAAQAEEDAQTLGDIVSRAAGEQGEVLFITDRHFLTFKMIEGVPLVPEYEMVTLMEMAMSGNDNYLDAFYGDLARHRFAVIVARKQRVVYKADEPFADENNVWTQYITKPILCYYDRSATLESAHVLLLVPRAVPQDCP